MTILGFMGVKCTYIYIYIYICVCVCARLGPPLELHGWEWFSNVGTSKLWKCLGWAWKFESLGWRCKALGTLPKLAAVSVLVVLVTLAGLATLVAPFQTFKRWRFEVFKRSRFLNVDLPKFDSLKVLNVHSFKLSNFEGVSFKLSTFQTLKTHSGMHSTYIHTYMKMWCGCDVSDIIRHLSTQIPKVRFASPVRFHRFSDIAYVTYLHVIHTWHTCIHTCTHTHTPSRLRATHA